MLTFLILRGIRQGGVAGMSKEM